MSSENQSQDTPTENEDLPKETIIIVGCVCGSVVIILTIVLVVLCCKRQQSKQQYEKQQETRMSPVLGSEPSAEPQGDSLPLKPIVKSGLDNPGLDQVDNSAIDIEKSRDGPFVTNTSAHTPNVGHQWGSQMSYENHRNEHVSREHGAASPAGQHYPDHPYPSPREYNNIREPVHDQHREPSHRDPSHRDPSHRDPSHRDPSHRDPSHRDPSHRDSTHSNNPHREPTHNTHRDPAQEHQKPKKVIYEVVV